MRFVFDRMAYLCLFEHDQIHGPLAVHGTKLLPHVDWQENVLCLEMVVSVPGRANFLFWSDFS